ncbi:hypothetical protein HPJ96_03500 [Treponema phagedenis]|nr:hypothetical protein HPJ96_03500 [Treponema phagedenis]
MKSDPHQQFKIELKKADYSKSEVEKIIAICFEEMNTSIDRAFDEGYKQGLLAASPDAAYYKRLSKDLEKEVNRLQSWRVVPWWTIPLCIAGGTALGFSFSYLRK